MQEICLLHRADPGGISCMPSQSQSAWNFLWSLQWNQQLSCVFTHCLRSLLLAKILPNSTKCGKGLKGGVGRETFPQDKRRQINIFQNHCQRAGFCSSWIRIHVMPPAINILNLGPSTVCPGPHTLSIWLLQERKSHMSKCVQKSRFGELLFRGKIEFIMEHISSRNW